MKTKEEIAKYLESHKVELFDLITIQGYLHVKGIDANYSVGDGKILTAKTFIDWFESGVLIPYEFYYSQDGKYSWVIQFKELREKEFDPICYYYMLKIYDNTLNYNWRCNNNGWVKATPAQKQRLIDKVEGETGKVWNEDPKMFEDKPKDILVPECIKIIKYQNNQLGLVFNDNKQVLTFSEGVYIVLPLDK